MDEARAVLARLERIETLEREGAGTASLLVELRELVREATAWAERERDPRARAAAQALARAQRVSDDGPWQGSYRGPERLIPSTSASGPTE